MNSPHLLFGVGVNRFQFVQQLVQVLLVGFTIGMFRTVVPALAESEFALPKNSFVLLSTFVVAFGVVKAVLNIVAGRLSEQIGRKKVLMMGWWSAVPIPFLIYFAASWDWIVAATLLLGINQGFAWSMSQTSLLDITRRDQRGLTIGLNEFSGYVGLALAGIITAYLATYLGPRMGLLIFGGGTITLALLLTVFCVVDTLPWAKAESITHSAIDNPLSTWNVFLEVSWSDRRLMAISQAGLVEKFVDALIWIFYPLYFLQQGLSLPQIAWVVGIYGITWGASQLFTGKLSDHVGRYWPNVSGMWICGGGVGLTLLGDGLLWWSLSSAVTGFGMALLYPNLSAAVADIAPAKWRGSAIGIYRFWRDLGYGIGALALGIIANISGSLNAVFLSVVGAMFLSGFILWLWTNPKKNLR